MRRGVSGQRVAGAVREAEAVKHWKFVGSLLLAASTAVVILGLLAWEAHR